MLVAGALLPFLPMLPLQVLVQNLFSDLAQLGLAFDRVDERDVAGPRTFDPRDLVRFVVLLGPIGTLFDLATFAGLWWLLDAHGSHAARELFRSGWFAENLVAQALAILLLRSRGLGRGGPLPTWPVLAAAALIGLGGLALPFSPVAGVLGFVPLPGETIPLLVSVVVGYTVLTVTVRAACVRTWRRWL
jgi:Mg2+-importing ATPase